jgi:guanidinopropionase
LSAEQERLGDAPLYITFDLDCLDPSVAPAVSNLEPGFTGFTIDEATRLLRAVRGKEVIGGDVVCLMPTKDLPNGITAMVAAAVAFELIGLIVDRLAAPAG